jgi:ribosome-binding protein aMBF1 (putative translation factor)
MWRYPNSEKCVDILTPDSELAMARRTFEVRKPRDIGDAIRAVREARGISQENLAQANAYDRFYLHGLESGRSNLYVTRPLRTLKSLGIILSVTFDSGQPADDEAGSGG